MDPEKLVKYHDNPLYAPFFGVMGSCAAIVFSCLGAAYGTAKSGKFLYENSIRNNSNIQLGNVKVLA